MTRRRLSDFYIASCEKDGGVYEFSLLEGGEFECRRKLPCDSPMYLARDDGKLYALLRAPFSDSSDSGLLIFDEASGNALGATTSTLGEVACHLSVKDGDVYAVNYTSGSVVRLGSQALKLSLSGKSVDEKRQTSPHPHSAILSPDKKCLIVADLGTDTVSAYSPDLKLIASASVPLGHGPRHTVFSKTGEYLYCINEMGGSITVFSWNGTALSPIKTYGLLNDANALGSGAAIKLSQDGSRLYVTERAAAELITLAANGEGLEILSRVSTHGKEPRDLCLFGDGEHLAVANQWSNSVSLFHLDENGIPSYLCSHPLPSPLCIVERK